MSISLISIFCRKVMPPAKQNANKIVGWVQDHEVDLDSLVGDSTPPNTGWNGFTFTFIEVMLGGGIYLRMLNFGCGRGGLGGLANAILLQFF